MQVTPHVHAIRLPFTIQTAPDIAIERFVNIFLIAGQSLTLIDTGVAGSERQIFDYIQTIGREPSEIARILLTHSHPDHIGAARAIRDATGCSIVAHAAEKAWIEDVNLQCRERPVPGFHILVGGPVPVRSTLEDGGILQLADDHDLDLVIMHTPGHSAGSVSFFLKGEGVLFTGDSVPVPGEIPIYEDILASVESIKRLARTDRIQIMLSSWDRPWEGILAYQRLREALDWLQRIHTTVIRTSCTASYDPVELSRSIAAALGFPPQVVTPLLARTFSSHLRFCNRPQLIIDDDNLNQPGGSVTERDRAGKLLR
ncbi:MAG: Hydroxyacylglutathione hydrolase [Methanoregula sp. PtaU1.Bin051]|nr:MAG: Hydroxyacylglutathione hydrolase [Methanoregula sp. PtaU1.Bin051]